ncbi:CBS domain-containing protein [Oceanospirillum sediminis]|uniref:CBS domain-containing protein n=1 Tax=Oceanospirillum sediminis TaxID=2760088 RepID=A0A839IMK6_9GAMM|nr:CBS domain-containing protein [Oceanospirillum sediminis]MBB1485707.1 CBS domain-containing protein [Oceanospirillum sediminis]
MKVLTLHPVENHYHLVHPEEFHHLTADDSALAVFTDFKKHIPQSVMYDLPAIHAESQMRKAHVRMQVVVDHDGELVGAISLNDLGEQNFIQAFQQEGLKRDEVRVKDLMIPKNKLQTLDYSELSNANIQNILDTLQQNYQQHCLVTDSSQGQIRGLISAADIARRLHIAIEIEKPTSFYDICMAIRH